MSYSRIMQQSVKDKISNSLRGRKLSDETKEKISLGVKKAWSRVPKDVKLWGTENNNNNKTSNNDEKSKI